MARSSSQDVCLLLKAAWCCVWATVVLTPPALAQGAGSATVRGVVTDASGGVLPGATVTVVNQRTVLTRTATTDTRGEYVITALVSGPYRVQVDLPAFARWKSAEFHLSPGDSRHLAATLEVAGRSEAVDVEAARAVARTDTGARESVIGADDIQEQTIISRGALELLRILPGTVSDQNMEMVSFTSGSNDLWSYSVNGQRGSQLNPVLDGSKVLDIGLNGSVMANINPDMVEEVKVQSSNYAAEYGSGTVQITAVTKSGSSALRGSVYDYWRNWRFAANDRSNNYAGVPRPKSDYHYPGFNLGGPLLLPGTDYNKKKDKLFFFVGFEVQRQSLDPGTTLGVVPTLAQREGDFRELLADDRQNLGQPTVVTIPAGFPGAGEPAPGNDLRPYVDRYGRVFLSLYPLPNYSDPENRFNYAFNTPQPLNRWQLVSRLDWNVSAATHAYVRLALEREKVEWARGLWNGGGGFELPSAVVGDNRSASVSATLTSVLSPGLTNEIVVSYTRLKLDNAWKDPARVSLAALGIPDYRGAFETGSDEVPLSFHSWGQNLGNLDAGGGLPIFAHNDSFSVAEGLTKVLGTHTLKLGAFVERAQKQQNSASPLQGSFRMYGPGTVGGTGNDYGDLLVGRMGQFYQETKTPRGDWRFWNFEAYVQDAWKPRPDLTLELGLRVAKMPNNQELNSLGLRLEPSAYDFTQDGVFIDGDPTRPNGVLLASRGEIPNGITEDPGLKAMPRINFAWDVQGRGEWILRGGAGIFYTRPPGGYQYQVQQVAPNKFNTTVNWWQADGGLTIGGLPEVDPYARGSVWVDSLDARSINLPRTITWSLAVDRRLPGQQTLEVAYVGNRQDYLPNRTLASYIVPGSLTGTVGNADLSNPLHRVALDPGVAATFRVFPAYNDASWWWQYEAVAHYHGLQTTLSRTAGRVHYLVNYTFSKVLGTTGHQDNTVIDPLDPHERSYGVPIWDRTHIFNASYNVIVPDAIRPDGNSFLRGLLNGWQVSGLTRYSSGLPFHVNFTGDIVSPEVQRAWWGTDAHAGPGTWNAGNASGVTPILRGSPQLPNTGVGERILDLDKIVIPAFGESGPFQSPYYLRAPSRWNFDVSVIKNVPLGGSKRLQFRVGFFNLFNQALPVFWMGDVDFNLQTECNVRVDGVPNGSGGLSDGVCDPAQGFHYTENTVRNFGKIVTKRGHRVIELAARFDF